MTEDRYHLTAEGTVTEDMMRRVLDVAQPHMKVLSAEVITAFPEVPPGVMLVTLLAFYLGRLRTGEASASNAAL